MQQKQNLKINPMYESIKYTRSNNDSN